MSNALQFPDRAINPRPHAPSSLVVWTQNGDAHGGKVGRLIQCSICPNKYNPDQLVCEVRYLGLERRAAQYSVGEAKGWCEDLANELVEEIFEAYL